jgi:hypothetical protein
MRIIISPAKQMRVDTDSFACKELPVFMKRTEVLMKWIQSLSYEEQKMDALAMRELYTKYKTAPSEADRERARREYLDRRGVPESFRW